MQITLIEVIFAVLVYFILLKVVGAFFRGSK